MPSRFTRVVVHAIAICGGAAAAMGVMGVAMGVVGWLSGGYYTPLPFVGFALVAAAIGLALRRKPLSPVMRTASGAGAWLSVALLSFCAVGSGYIDTREASYKSALRSDLRNLASDQDDFRRDSGRYSEVAPRTFRGSSGVSAPVIAMTNDGWTASVTHTQVPLTCVIFVGRTSIAPAVAEREPACNRAPFDLARYLVSVGFLAAGIVLAALAYALEARLLHQHVAAT